METNSNNLKLVSEGISSGHNFRREAVWHMSIGEQFSVFFVFFLGMAELFPTFLNNRNLSCVC